MKSCPKSNKSPNLVTLFAMSTRAYHLSLYSPIFFYQRAQSNTNETQLKRLFILFFSNTNFTEKMFGFSGIRTRIVGVEGEHADHFHDPNPKRVCRQDLINSFLLSWKYKSLFFAFRAEKGVLCPHLHIYISSSNWPSAVDIFCAINYTQTTRKLLSDVCPILKSAKSMEKICQSKGRTCEMNTHIWPYYSLYIL